MSTLERISRREFLRQTGRAGGGLVFALTMTGAGRLAFADEASTPSVAPNVYVNVRDDDIVEIYCHRSEMGQGIRTCLPQVIADELDAQWDRIELIQALGDEKYGDQNTDGSTSIRRQFDILRNAGATARALLIAAAAKTWGVPAAECITREQTVRHAASGRSARYGELVEVAAGLDVPSEVPFKDPADYRYIGHSMDLIDGFDMTTGRAHYGIDTVLPDMLYASIERSPALGGTVKSLDDQAARAIAGVVDVIELPPPTSPPVFNPLGGVAVLAGNTWAAERGREALEIQWDPGPNAVYDSTSYRETLTESARNGGKQVLNRGDVDTAFAGAART
ncbi:MAG: molybdopterin cofactor-binding domain-containing protein, partial [Woeseiaceae bacterium]